MTITKTRPGTAKTLSVNSLNAVNSLCHPERSTPLFVGIYLMDWSLVKHNPPEDKKGNAGVEEGLVSDSTFTSSRRKLCVAWLLSPSPIQRSGPGVGGKCDRVHYYENESRPGGPECLGGHRLVTGEAGSPLHGLLASVPDCWVFEGWRKGVLG